MPNEGDRKLRYPANDPEEGPAEWHVWHNGYWQSERELKFMGSKRTSHPTPLRDFIQGDVRKWKRMERKAGADDPMYNAWIEGQDAAMYGPHLTARERRNPYPPGKRRTEWDRGYAVAGGNHEEND